MNEEKHIFLLRAFGDFIIAIYTASKNRLDVPVVITASKHLEPLYRSIPVALPSNISIRFHDFRIKHTIFSCFTNKFIASINTFKELWALRKYTRENVSREKVYYMENRKRLFLPKLFTGCSFQYIVSDQNAYKAYADFFCIPFGELEDIPFTPRPKGTRILVVPDARQSERNISDEVVRKIIHTYERDGNTITVATFRKKNDGLAKSTEMYEDFTGLIKLIRNSDAVIGADSMPIHIAQMLGKPHFILHPAYVKDQFFTPFSLKYNTHFTFEDIASRNFFLPNE